MPHLGFFEKCYRTNVQCDIVKVVTVKESEPIDRDLPGHSWTLKKLRAWVAAQLSRTVSRNILGQILKRAGLSWKRCKKRLAKADPRARAASVQQLKALFACMLRDEIRTHLSLAWRPV